ncbi:hypothetical protein FBR02_04290 [Anaerolineae bacterium CFX9]|jgi:spoIIIJ-associated protein|nr:hypothetical protein [Anaerolineae bacterium CFX9]
MNPENVIETTGSTVEEAIAEGLRQLDARPFDVIVEVLEEGSQGGSGMAPRMARVRLKRLTPMTPTDFSSQTPISAPVAEDTPIVFPVSEPAEPPARRQRSQERPPRERRRDQQPRRDSRRSEQNDTPAYMDVGVEEDENSNVALLYESFEVPEAELDEEAQIGRVVLNELLERMSIRAKIVVRKAKPDDQTGDSPWILDVIGSSDLNRLIGRRGDTLASLQYITRLVTSRELQKRSEIIVDVTGFKAKRARGLHTMAHRMADQAVSSGGTVSLEPMPPHERRIIHLALRERPDVVTKSVGEGVARKVTIVPRQPEA